jgi:hypothetical protein
MYTLGRGVYDNAVHYEQQEWHHHQHRIKQMGSIFYFGRQRQVIV